MEEIKRQELVFYPTVDGGLMAYDKDSFIFTGTQVDENARCIHFQYQVNKQDKRCSISFEALQMLIEGKLN